MAALAPPQAKSPLINPSASPSSPRLPSPPPIAEDQTIPKSPSPSRTRNTFESPSAETGQPKISTQWRVQPGMTRAQIEAGPPLIPYHKIDSAFQAQEYLKALYRHHTTSPEDPSRTIPLKRETAEALCEPPSGCDESVWLFELTCLLVRKLNLLIRALFTCDPPCSVQTCDEMRASEWQYLCAVHDPPKSCSAIDYCCHTMEWAERTLTNPELFSSRLMQEGLKETRGGQVQEEPIGFRHISNIVRRLYRLFAHAWFEHRPVFWQLENGVGLYTFCKTMSDHYGLIPARNFTIPLEAEGIMSDDADYDETNESIGEQLLPVALDPEIGEVNDTLPASGTDATPATSKSVSQSKAKEGPLPGVEEEDEEQEEEHKEGEDGGHDDGEEQSGQDELGEPPAPVTKRHVSPTRKQPARSLDIEGPSQKAADQEKDEGQEILVSMELDEEVPGESVKKQLPEKEVELVAEPEGIESSAEVPKLQGKETVEAAEEKKA